MHKPRTPHAPQTVSRRKANSLVVSSTFGRRVGIIHPDMRDHELLERVLPEGALTNGLLTDIKYIALARGVDLASVHWISETLFHLAIEHEDLKVVARKRGHYESVAKVAKDIGWLRFACRLKVTLIQARARSISVRLLAYKLAELDRMMLGDELKAVDRHSEELSRLWRSNERRLGRLIKLFPGVVAGNHEPLARAASMPAK